MLHLTAAWSALALSLLAMAAVPNATAQGSDAACEETEPCPVVVDVDQDGFVVVSPENFTQGDWFYLNVCNAYDEVEHTVTLDGYDISLEVPAGECVPADSDQSPEGFQFDVAGHFDLMDEPTGDTWQITVLEGDVVEEEEEDEEDTDPGRETDDDGTPGDENGSPAVGSVLLGITLLAVAGLVSRRSK